MKKGTVDATPRKQSPTADTDAPADLAALAHIEFSDDESLPLIAMRLTMR